jgi:hypothetical protein
MTEATHKQTMAFFQELDIIRKEANGRFSGIYIFPSYQTMLGNNILASFNWQKDQDYETIAQIELDEQKLMFDVTEWHGVICLRSGLYQV